jgi:hypothetical protein
MGSFATTAMLLEAMFWIILISVFGIFVAALFKGLLEDIRDHRRISARRQMSQASLDTQRLTRRAL